ncbi:MAG: uridine phosphorylase [Thermoprotei archaeon]
MDGERVSATQPTHLGGAYHIGLKRGDLPRYVLLPGDPERLSKIASTWSSSVQLAKRRQYVSIRGSYKGVDISALSTGIGGPAVSIVVEELAWLGVDTMIRVGSCGSVREDVKVGDIVITKAALRFDGASNAYAPPGFPAAADPEVYLALVEAAGSLGVRYHTGLTATFDAFYVAQGRPGFKGYLPRTLRSWVEDMRSLNVVNVEMEGATLLTLSNLYGLRGGVVCSVFANRVTDEFGEVGEIDAIMVANEAIRILEQGGPKR